MLLQRFGAVPSFSVFLHIRLDSPLNGENWKLSPMGWLLIPLSKRGIEGSAGLTGFSVGRFALLLGRVVLSGVVDSSFKWVGRRKSQQTETRSARMMYGRAKFPLLRQRVLLIHLAQ